MTGPPPHCCPASWLHEWVLAQFWDSLVHFGNSPVEVKSNVFAIISLVPTTEGSKLARMPPNNAAAFVAKPFRYNKGSILVKQPCEAKGHQSRELIVTSTILLSIGCWTGRGSNRVPLLRIRNLLIPQIGRNARNGENATLRYTAGTWEKNHRRPHPSASLTSALGQVKYRIGNEIAFHSVTMAKGRTNS